MDSNIAGIYNLLHHLTVFFLTLRIVLDFKTSFDTKVPLVNKKAYGLAILSIFLNLKSSAYFPREMGSIPVLKGNYDFTVPPDCFFNFTF
jgi:hypothetical protein